MTTRPYCAITATQVSQVVAYAGCTPMLATAYLQAEEGDVAAACESWRVDHRHFEMPALCHRAVASLEVSDV